MVAIHPPSGPPPLRGGPAKPGLRPSSARPASGGRNPHRARGRPHSARPGFFLPHPPAQQPPDAVASSSSNNSARSTSTFQARLDYQKQVDREREAARELRMEREREQRADVTRQAAINRRRKHTLAHNLDGMAASAAQPESVCRTEGPPSEPEDPVDEPTGSFRRRHAAHHAVMQTLRKENPRADRRAVPPLGHEWRDLNRGLNNLFRERGGKIASTAVSRKKTGSMITGYRTAASAALPGPRQKALKRQMGVLEEFYQVGQAGRVLGEVDKSFAKRRANPDGVTKDWAMDVDKKRDQLAPWAARNPDAVFGKQTETIAQRRDRLRAELAQKRREREAKKSGDEVEVDGVFTLRTNEHASLALQLALQREARSAKNEEKLADVARPIGPRVATNVENRVAACILPLCAQAQSKSVEVQRDVAAALYSLSIADENKPAFVEAQALETLIEMAHSKDPDIRRNIAGAMYRLSMCTSIKRPFVELGVLRPLLVLAQGSKDREVQRYSMLAIKELCEKRANHVDIIDAHALPILYTNLDSADPRIRKEAIWTLNHLADDETNRLRMLRDGALSKMLQNVQAQDVALRRGSASTLFKFSKLKEVASADIVKELTSKTTLSALIGALVDRDLDVNTDLCKALIIMKSAKLTKMMLANKGLANVLAHASRLVDVDGTGEIHANLTQVMTVLLTFMPAKYPQNVMVVINQGYMSTLLHLCKYNSGKVRRSAGKLLARLSTIEEAKAGMMANPDTITLLNSLCKQSDYSSQMTAVKVIAELAEEPKNRRPLYLAAVLPTLFECIRKGDNEMRFQCARAIADMAEAVELRVAIVYAGLEQILECMLSEDDHVQEQGMRILVNLVAPAGFACGAEEGGVGRYGALEALHVDDDLDEESSSESSSEDDEGESDEDDRDRKAASADAGIADGLDGEAAMELIADMIDDQQLLDSAPSGGLAAVAMADAADDDSSDEEDDYDDDVAADEEQGAARREHVLQRARLLVHKAAIIEKEREYQRDPTSETCLNPSSAVADDGHVDSEARDLAAQVETGAAPSRPKKSLTAAAVKAESNFSRYRRTSVHTITDEKKKEEADSQKVQAQKPRRRLSVNWSDMASLLGHEVKGKSGVDEQSDEWWSTDEGKRVKIKHNTINVDRIHLKIAESNAVKRLLELVFDDTPHVSEYAETVISFMVAQGRG